MPPVTTPPTPGSQARTPHRRPALAAALVAALAASLTLTACGGSGGLSGDAVASVDGKAITKSEFAHWASITRGAAAASGAPTPDPPTYANCIAALRKQARPVKGQPAPTEATLLAQCRAQQRQLSQQTMATLLQNVWITGEAKKEGIDASDAEVRKQLATTKKQSFPTAAAYQKFLKQSGMTQDEVLGRVRVQLLAQKIAKKVQGTSSPVTDAAAARYYATHKADFTLPERRDLQVILAKSRAQAQQARTAVEAGMSWHTALLKYSKDRASKKGDGTIHRATKSVLEGTLGRAAFGTPNGATAGPVKGLGGWYVVRVKRIYPAGKQTLAQANTQIKALLAQQSTQAKMTRFTASFQKRWKAETKCRAGYIVPLCSNAPKPKPAAAMPGGVPQSSSAPLNTQP